MQDKQIKTHFHALEHFICVDFNSSVSLQCWCIQRSSHSQTPSTALNDIRNILLAGFVYLGLLMDPCFCTCASFATKSLENHCKMLK